MRHDSLRPLGCLTGLIFGVFFGSATWADPISAVQLLRVSGCAGVMPAMQPLQHNAQLDRAAALWAAGDAPARAAQLNGYRGGSVLALRLRGSDDAILQALRQTRCRALADQSLHDIGAYRNGPQTFVVMASAPGTAPASLTARAQALAPTPPPPQASEAPTADEPEAPPRSYAYATAPELAPAKPQASRNASRVLELVNEVRARGARCGTRSFGPTGPLRLSATLDSVAAEHAVDMARHDYFEHVDLTGQSPAERLRATGYRETLVGENIAYGPTSADEVVAGWLHSPDHCENIMDPRFIEMGLAYAPGQEGARRGLYWDQEFATPVK